MNYIDHLGFGCVSLTTHPFKATATRILNEVFEHGITHFDTAPLYGTGYSEKILGEFTKNKRDKVTIATKFGLSPKSRINLPIGIVLPLNYVMKLKTRNNKPLNFQTALSNTNDQKIIEKRISLKEVQKSLQLSLKNLKTDYIDYYLLHEAIPQEVNDDAVEFLIKCKESGIIRNLGVATSSSLISKIPTDFLQIWEVLQYESSFSKPPNTQEFHAGKFHIRHSILKYYRRFKPAPILPSMLLMLALKQIGTGKVLFSTSKMDHLIDNLNNMKLLENYSEQQLITEINKCHL